jgi:two-component sensor histidine kinase
MIIHTRAAKLIFLLLFTLQNLNAQNVNDIIVLNDKVELKSVGTQMYFLKDENANLSFAEMLGDEQQKKFALYTADVYTHKASTSVVWFKLTLQNKTGEDAWLSTGGNVCWYVDFYRPTPEGAYDEVKSGGMRPVSTREYPVNFYWFKLADRSDTTVRTYYVRIASGLTQEYFLQAGTIQSLTKNKESYDFLTAAFVGLMIVMSLYNLFLASATKDKIYLTYVCYLISVVIAITFANGYPFSDEPFLLKYYIGWVPIFFFFTTLFAVQYLNLPVHAPLLNKILWIMLSCFFLIPILFLMGLELSLGAYVFQFLLFPFFLTLLFSGIYLLYKGHKNARFYVLGWSFEIVSVLVSFMAMDGVLPFNIATRNAIYFGTSMEVLMFSLALADRLNILRQEKDRAEAERLTIIREQNRVLEQRVVERTAEIHHRVKNNLQIISSLINLKSRQANHDIKQILNQLNGRIFSMGLLHEQLYKNENLRSIRLDMYLVELAKHLLESFRESEASVKLEVDCEPLEISADHSLTYGLICNELFTNSMKYAFTDQQEGKAISIRLKLHTGFVVLEMSDNGRKVKSTPEDLTKSFGLRFVDQLVTSKLGGKWNYRLDEGFKAVIQMPIETNGKS